ncbi:hypothetical protein ACFQZ4_35805 [Catellatospora coxensis]|uniref:Uncharacterized protein n=1 Tax=Catellatospora coxensis TaxID=310354 RepID=A0A8J3L397_9ACTN|nr:hypothetical protein [Catellatospora coxensis]GIG07791.1 hypothetical protein Cco03nite_44910 [Catellatospora coxensis]
MYVNSDLALCLVDEASAGRADDADKVWRSAIREAIACNVPIEHVASRANVSVEEILSIVSESQVVPA